MRSYGTTNAAPYASAPAVGAAGDTYFNTGTKTLWLSDGTSWIQAGGSVAPAASYFYGAAGGGAVGEQDAHAGKGRAQGIDQRCFLHHRAACDIDEERARPQRIRASDKLHRLTTIRF
jgi:hypothetical protein